MPTPATVSDLHEVGVLLRGEPDALGRGAVQFESRRFAFHIAVIAVGAGCYGAAMGWWRDPWQALYVAIKFPLILLLITLGNALLNAMLAPLLGLNIPFRQSLLAVLMSFAITSAILGAFSPLAAFVVWNAPPMTPDVKSSLSYGFIKLTHVAVIAFAGVAGSVRLFQLLAQLASWDRCGHTQGQPSSAAGPLRRVEETESSSHGASGNRAVAWRVLFAWLAVNLFLGSQLVWIARPFIGSPQLPVVFLRDTAFQGNFYEDVFRTLLKVFQFD